MGNLAKRTDFIPLAECESGQHVNVTLEFCLVHAERESNTFLMAKVSETDSALVTYTMRVRDDEVQTDCFEITLLDRHSYDLGRDIELEYS